MTLQLTIVVPAFDEAHRLADGMRRFDAAVSAGAIDLDRTEVLVVDDGSTDDTAAVAEKLLAALPHHRVLRLPCQPGQGRRRAGRGGRVALALHGVHGRRHGHRPAGRPPAARRPRARRRRHRVPGAARLDGRDDLRGAQR